MNKWRTWMMLLVLGGGLMLLYVLTAQRGVCWQDSGEYQRRIILGDTTGIEGIARAHPLYIIAAQGITSLAKSHDAALWIANGFSGVAMALAATLVALLVLRLSANQWAAMASGLLFGLAHMSWWLATITETYSWSVAFLMVELWLLVNLLQNNKPKWLYALALVSGAGVAIHNFALLTIPVWSVVTFILIYRRELPKRSLFLTILCWGLGASSWLYLIAKQTMETDEFLNVCRSALFADLSYGKVVGMPGKVEWHLFLANMLLFAVSLASPLWLCAVKGWRDFRTQSVSDSFIKILKIITVIHVVFFVRYFVADQATFCLPTLALLSIWSGLGLHLFLTEKKWCVRKTAIILSLMLICPVLIYTSCAIIAGKTGWQPSRTRKLPFRNEARYWLLPWKHDENSATKFARAALSQTSGSDVIYADGTAAGPLLLEALKIASAKRPQIFSYYDPWTRERAAWDSFLQKNRDKDLYVVSVEPGYLPAGLKGRGAVCNPTGVLYRVTFTP